MINYLFNKLLHNWFLVSCALGLSLAVVVIASTVAGQGDSSNGKVKSSSASATSTVDPLKLTAEELSAIEKINIELKPLVEESNLTYQAFLIAKTAAERCRHADQLWIAVKQLEPVQKRQVEWLAEARKAHKCFDCLIEQGSLVKPKQ